MTWLGTEPLSNGAGASHKMENQRDDGYDQQQVNEPSRNVKSGKTEEPQNQKNSK